MKRLLLTLTLLWPVMGLADFDAGLRAYQRGDYITAVREWRPLAEQGNADAQYWFAEMYAVGNGGLPLDSAKAIEWYRKAAEQGKVDAQMTLSRMYASGVRVTKNDAEAAKWYRVAAKQGNAKAQYKLGIAYRRGKGVAKNRVESMKWFRLAAKQGHSGAQQELGYMFDKGEGVPEDDAEAVKWYHKSAARLDSSAWIFLTNIYDMRQTSVPDVDVAAVKRYRSAAEDGEILAQNILGVLYGKGVGVPEDFVQAYAWLNLAAAQGYKPSVRNKESLRKLMTTVEVVEAYVLSRKLCAKIPNCEK